MKLYTENVGMVSKKAIYKMIKDYFDDHCRDQLNENGDALDPGPDTKNWTLESITEHFEHHTKFPTDEINKQLVMLKKLRDLSMASVIMRKGTEIKVNNKNVAGSLSIMKEIRELMQLKSKINGMIGYSEVLDF